MQRLLQAIIDWPIRRPKTVVFAYAVVTAVALFGLTRLKQEDNLLVFLPTSDPDVRLFKDVSHRFGGLRVALIGVELPPSSPRGADVFSGEVIRKLQAATQAIHNTHGVDRVVSLTSVTDVTAGPAGAEVTQLVGDPPATAEAEAALRQKVMSRDHVVGNVVSKDGRAALILVFLAEGSSDREVTQALRHDAESTLAPLTIYYGGAPFAGRSIYQEAQSDVRRLSPLALAVLLLVVVFSFRDPVGVVLTVASVAFSVLLVLGGMGLWGDKFTVASSTLPVILFASGSSYAVHVLGRYYLLRADRSATDAIRESLSIVGAPLAIAAATTAVGFYSFVATDVPPMRAFGIACGSGVLLCWFTSLTLVPAVVALWPRDARPPRQLGIIGEWLVALWHFSRRRRAWVIALFAVVVAALFVPTFRVTVKMEPNAFFRPGSEPWLAERFLNQRFGGAEFVQVALSGDLDDPWTLRELDKLDDFARSLPGVTQVQAITQPLRLVNDVMGGGKRLPATRAQAANLYFFLEGEAGMSSLLAPGRKEALLHVRVRGEAEPAVEALERYVARELPAHPAPPTPNDVAERISWLLKGLTGHAAPDVGRLAHTLSLLAVPGDNDEAWLSRRTEIAAHFFASDEAPELEAGARDELLALVKTSGASPALKSALEKDAPSPEEGGLAFAGLSSQLEDARRDLAVKRALPQALQAAGLDPDRADPEIAQHLAPVLDDLFLPASARDAKETARAPLTAKVAGEPILDRGFSRSVERNQIRSLLISVVAVLLLLLLLFRSFTRAAVAMLPALVTMVVMFGVMGLEGLHIDLGTSLVAGIATGAGSDFAMHYLWYLRRQPADEVSRSVGPVMVVSILLVSFGFVVLAFGRSPVMRLFGTLAGLAMSLSALFTCLLVPALLNKFGSDPGPKA